MITMEPKIQSTTSTRALRSKIGPIKAYLFKTSYVISPITPSDLKHSMKGAYKSFLSKTDQAYGHSTSTINPKLYPISTFKQMSLVVVPSFMIESPFEVVAIALIAFLLILLSMREHRHKKDILDTERNMAEEVIRLREKAEESNRLTSAFLANMSHEIRTPLNAIVGFSDVLSAGDTAIDDQRGYFEIIKANSDLLLRLINDILDVSRLEADRVTLTLEKCDVVQVCTQVTASVTQARRSSNRIVFESAADSLEIRTDIQRLQQVVINLLSNADKFTENGTITLKLEPDMRNRTALFSVSDTGCGIPPEKRKRVFERFEKLNEYAQGTGLGLSICKLIVEKWGGRIWIDSQYTRGARFVFTHPLDL